MRINELLSNIAILICDSHWELDIPVHGNYMKQTLTLMPTEKSIDHPEHMYYVKRKILRNQEQSRFDLQSFFMRGVWILNDIFRFIHS